MATPFMGLTVPVPGPGGTPGPQWAQEVNADLGTIDAHDHTPGNGVPLSIAAISVNQDFSLNNFSLTDVLTLQFFNNGTTTVGTNFLSNVAGNLYYNDGNGNIIQITAGGGLNASSIGGIGGDYVGSTASAFYSSGLSAFGFTSAPGVPAVIIAGDYQFTSLDATNVVTISNPNSGSSYTLNLPDALPAGDGIMVSSNTGTMDFWAIDNSSIVETAGVLSSTLQGEHNWELNGGYSTLTFPLINIDSVFIPPYDITILSVWIYNGDPGSGGTTEYDLFVTNTGGGPGLSILSTTGKITSAAASTVWTDSGSVVNAQTGVTKPVISTFNILAGYGLLFRLVTSMTGSPTDARIKVFYKRT